MRKFLATLSLTLIVIAAAYAATVEMGALKLKGSSSGSITIQAPAAAGSNIITLPAGTTNFSTTGGANQVVKQTASGGAFSVAALGSGDVPCAAMPALTGDTTSSAGSCAATTGKVNGVTYGTSPSTNTVPVVTSANTITYEQIPNAALANVATTVNGQTCTLGSTCTITASAGTVTVGVTTVASGTNTKILFDNSGTLGEYTISGSGNVAMTTSPTFTTPALGTPSALVLTNATGLPCAAMPALTGGVTTSAGSCATTVASVPTSAITGIVTDEICASWDSNASVVAATVSFPIPWATYTVPSVKSAVNGGGSFTANVKIASTSITSCSAISVSGATNTSTSCTAANTGMVNDIINIVITAPSGTVNQAYVCPVFTHSVN